VQLGGNARTFVQPHLTARKLEVIMRLILIYHAMGGSMRRIVFWMLLIQGLWLAAGTAYAEEAEFKLTLRDHKFEPSELTVPAGAKIKLLIDNQDSTPEEFESYELNREKIVPGKGTVVIYVGALKDGRYPFFGDFNKQTAQGVLVAK